MPLLRRPSPRTLDEFRAAQSELNLTYPAVGATAATPPPGYAVDHNRVRLGDGEAVFSAARAALGRWEQFRLGWVEAYPADTPIRPGEVVAVVARVLGVWWVNACRVVYAVDEDGPVARFGFAYGTLPGHAESGEERFLVEWDRAADAVWYDILAFSRPRHPLARFGYPLTRRAQRRFARDSAAAMLRAAGGGPRSLDNCGNADPPGRTSCPPFEESRQMTIPLSHVDAFADRPFAGNPAAVCLLPAWKADRWLQAIAREMNLSETAFLVKRPDHFDLRWFTPKAEVDLCGHATLASAHVLWQQGEATSDEIRFSTRSGILIARNKQGEIELDFPLEPDEPVPPPADLVAAFNISPAYVGKNRFDYILEVDSENTLRQLDPDFRLLATVPCRGVVVTSRSADPRFDFVSRAFFPRLGVDEDPVCGSAHCCLAEFWRKRLGKSEFVAFQASARGGVVKVRVVGDRVFLGGRAITVAKGEVLIEGNEP